LKTLEKLDLKRIAGQMLILGFQGSTADINSVIHTEIAENHVGGVILFDKDMVHNKPVHNIKSPEQVAALTSSLQSYSETPLFISIDQEGGVVNRLKADYGFPQTVSHLKLGERNDLNYTFEQASIIARTLEAAGINLNFAPVVDLDVNLANPIIHKKERSFSASSEEVINHTRMYIKAQKEHGILSTLKHFPGHGSSFGDTHLNFTDVTETWISEELEPYNQLITKEGFDEIVMTTHIYNAKLDSEHPSTLSKKVLTGILKEQIGFTGLIVSDDMQMKGITDRYGLDQAVILAINAGVDLLCFGNNLAKEPIGSKDLVEFLERGLEKKLLTEEQLINKYNRIIEFKHLKLRGSKNTYP
jgi:beta-N-acetylhexosaminidase